jgi:hypothetical protein
MNKQRIDHLIQLGDSSMSSKNYATVFDYYEQSLLSLSSEALKDKRSKNISSFAGWTLAFLTSGIGIEDLIVIPSVTQGVSKALGVDDDYKRIVLQAVCMREIDCILSSAQLRLSVPKQTVLHRFVMIFRSMKDSTSIEKLFSLYLHDLVQSTPFDDPETMQPSDLILLEEILSLDESKSNTAYLLYSYLGKVSDSSELFKILDRTFGSNSQRSRSRKENSSNRSANNSTAEDPSSYYQTLGLSTSATLDEIKNAYRDLMKKYHPDRFSTLSSEFQELANRRAQAINEAYEYLLKKNKHDFSNYKGVQK